MDKTDKGLKDRGFRRLERDGGAFWKGLLLPAVIFFCLLLFLHAGLGNVSDLSGEESREILRNAVLRAAVQCYAIEGMYPPDIKYLEDNYGLVYDQERFIIHYEVFAGNIPPDIAVIDFSI